MPASPGMFWRGLDCRPALFHAVSCVWTLPWVLSPQRPGVVRTVQRSILGATCPPPGGSVWVSVAPGLWAQPCPLSRARAPLVFMEQGHAVLVKTEWEDWGHLPFKTTSIVDS